MLLPFILLLLYLYPSTCEALWGDHVCAKIDKYYVPVNVSYTKPYKVRESYWCAKIPPRCTRERTEMKTAYQIENVTKTRVVNECCKGYVQEQETCVAFCPQGCQEGTCIAPGICQCHPEFFGPSCEKVYELVPISSSTVSAIVSATTLTTTSAPSSLASTTTKTPETTSATSTTTTTETPFAIAFSTTTTTPAPEIMSSTQKSYSPYTDEPAVVQHWSSTSRDFVDFAEKTQDLEAQSSDNSEVTVNAGGWRGSTTDSPIEIEPSTASSSPTSPPIPYIPRYFDTTLTSPQHTTEETGPAESPSSTTESIPFYHNFDPLQPFHTPATSGDPISSSSTPFGTTGYTSVIVVNNHSIHTVATHTPNHTQAMHKFFDDHMMLLVVVGAALSLILGTVLAVLVCQQIAKSGKKKQQQNSHQDQVRHLPPLPTAISLEMPTTPTIHFSACCESIDLQPAIYSMGTFKPAGRGEPTISQELREALEATYDHPPSQSRSCRSSEGQRSLAEMWEAVLSATKEREVQQPAPVEEEHLYQEIPCYHPQRLEIHDSRC